MSVEINDKIVPKLRFPEFRDEREWEEKSLGDVAIFQKGKGISKADISPDGVLPCIRYGELYTHYTETITTIKSFTNLSKDELLLSKANDVIIPASGETQEDIATASCVMQDGIALGGDLNIIRSDIDGVFLSYFLNNAKKKEIAQLAQGISVVHLYSSQLKTLKINIPIPKEQQKIADCLSSLDELISAENQKLEIYKGHKKGLMQQLFPGEGEKVPRLRFKEFEGDGEWVETTLKSVCKMQAGKFVSASEIKESQLNETYPCYGGNGLRGYTKSYTNQGTYSLIGRQGALCGNVTLAKGVFHATEHAVVVYPEPEMNTIWLFYLLNFLNLNQYATGQAQPGLSVDNLVKIELKVPIKEKEQQKIASCLSSLDELIIGQTEKIGLLKEHKKGLMQGMFV